MDRYDMYQDEGRWAEMLTDEEGEWVLYEDVAEFTANKIKADAIREMVDKYRYETYTAEEILEYADKLEQG